MKKRFEAALKLQVQAGDTYRAICRYMGDRFYFLPPERHDRLRLALDRAYLRWQRRRYLANELLTSNSESVFSDWVDTGY